DGGDWETAFNGVAGTSAVVEVTGDATAQLAVRNTLLRGRVLVRSDYTIPVGITVLAGHRPLVAVGGALPSPADGGTSLHEWEAVEVAPNTPVDVAATLTTGWLNTGIAVEGECQQGASAGTATTVTVGPGGDCIVTFVNEPFGTVTVEK